MRVENGYLRIFTIYRCPNTVIGDSYFLKEMRILYNGTLSVEKTTPILVPSLEEARRQVPEGLTMVSRDPSDDPHVVESWL